MEGDFLDSSKEHKLSELECELITMFRVLSETKQQLIMQALFQVLMNDKSETN